MLRLYPQDQDFLENIHELRQAVIRKKPHAPAFLNIILDGRAHHASTAHIRLDGLFAYSDDQGEHRITLEHVTRVEAYY